MVLIPLSAFCDNSSESLIRKCRNDNKDSIKLYDCFKSLASEYRLPKAYSEIGIMLYEGRGVKQNKEEAARYFKMSLSEMDSVEYLASYYLDTPSLQSEESLEDAADALLNFSTYVSNKYLLGLIYYKLNRGNEALDMLSQCSVLSTKADLMIGKMLILGDIIKADYERGIKHLKLAIQGGSSEANYLLGNFLLNKDSPYRNVSQGLDYIKKSAEMGYSEAQVLLVFTYINPNFDKRNIEMSKYYAESKYQANDSADMNAMRGFIYATADTPYFNKSTALRYLKKYVDQNSNIGIKLLAQSYHKGLVTEIDLDKAISLYTKSYRLCNYSAAKALAEIYSDKNSRFYNPTEADIWSRQHQ